MPNVAVLTNDLQYEFTYKITRSAQELEQKLTAFNQFLDDVRNQNQAVIHLQLINDPDDPAVQRRYKNRAAGIPALAGRPENQIIDSIYHPSDLIVVKGRDSGFFNNNLDETLQNLGIKTVIVTGLQTHVCVQTTAADAFFRGYNVWVPEDCVFAPSTDDTTRALEWLANYCATVAPSTEILSLLAKHSDLPERNEGKSA
ncbi:MAG: cysteine hydrolase [Citrobacter sp.]|jgi:nicotinamidase-related amidase|uniref:cysteine hydrolase n=1 Tax=Citrobacter TaxID=544 RepID=UPI0015EAFA1A|nr:MULTISPECIES: cysteine hydrolase [Citrobacter]MDU1183711.1 cysteine hydrolase [Citrobacter sp.]MBJ8951573.1 cysteine hydrolase [Citrobacter braakii]MDM3316273.1 cysteine hydrolase [Citrobacter sp. Cb220]QLR48284.1 cysteine hydrolase [Citrobacter sp. RHBSTW-00986]HCB1681950.1 cysteine hydrolase [Citrobacter braakii]